MILVIGNLLCPSLGFAQEVPSVPDSQKRYFKHFVDKRSYKEQFLNLVGLTSQDVGRSFALIAGVTYYPNMPTLQRDLKPAAEDLARLEDYLKNVEFFDEIVVLKDMDVSLENLRFFLQIYFPERLKQFPKSRFLFAYSGHGFNEGASSYLLESGARSLEDRAVSINVATVKVWVDEVVEAGHQVLVLLNSCYSGAFLKRSFGGKHFIPKYPGAHAITAGGTKEQAWHDPAIGPGSIFFEKLFAGLEGRADSLPAGGGDGLVTVDELASYLRYEVQVSTDQTQNPQFGDISKSGSLGGFFFLNRLKPVEAGIMTAWKPGAGLAFGEKKPEPVVAISGPTFSLPKQLSKTITGKDGAAMVLVPEGKIIMGSSSQDIDRWLRDHPNDKPSVFEDEVPQHRVTLDAFYIDKFEVTTSRYASFMQATGRREPAYWSRTIPVSQGEKPVVGVTWDDAKAYCEHYGKRLPTEAEWEKAARGTDGRLYPWGNEAPTSRHANIDQCCDFKEYGVLTSVGSREAGASPYGAYDLAGNVWEWTADWYGEAYYGKSPERNPTGPSTGTYRVLRGGSWSNEPFDTRSADRNWVGPMDRLDFIGFRCVQDAP